MFNLLRLKSVPIYEQLLIEERLLRGSDKNWCLINEGSTPAIVMGISGKKEELVDEEKAKALQIPLIKRFSGGGTVVVDENTLFVTFICQKELHDFPAYPEPIMCWTEQIYAQALGHPGFRLKENDYVIENRKFGGNAQYIKKDRWLHHSTLLWDYDPAKMQCLKHPKKTPPYRAGRAHDDFLCRLSEFYSTPGELMEQLIGAMAHRFPVEEIELAQAMALSHPPERQSTWIVAL